jgi:hypothetical protein
MAVSQTGWQKERVYPTILGSYGFYLILEIGGEA